NLVNFFLGSAIGRIARLERDHQVTCEYSSGMRSNGTALVVGLASFPHAPLVTVPAAIYIIFQHLLASIVKSRLVARFGDIDRLQAAAAGSGGPPASPATPPPRPEGLPLKKDGPGWLRPGYETHYDDSKCMCQPVFRTGSGFVLC